MADVRLTLLGPPTVSCGSANLTAQPSAKALALLTYLVLEPGPHTREELAGLLWGESSEEEARASLRQVLKHLRADVGEVLRSDRTLVEVTGTVDCEVQTFDRLVAQHPQLAAEIEIPRFLAGFSVRHAPRFDEWTAETRRKLLRKYQDALAALARDAMGQWRWRDALQLADRWLSSDPLSDEAVRVGIQARYLAGDRGAALALYQQYRTSLQEETGSEPSRSLLNLMRRVEADAAPISTRPITDEWYARAPTFEASLIGRQQEWAALLKSWKQVKRGSGRVALLEGEPGVGKSRLAAEFLRWAVADGGVGLHGRGNDILGGVPYEPVVELLSSALTAPGLSGTAPEWLTEVARLVPEIRQRFPALPAPGTPSDPTDGWRLFEGVAQLLLSLSAERPLILFVDDLQSCDSDSCKLLRYLIRRTEQAPVLWISTVSLGEPEREAPAARLCRVLRAQAHASVITLEPLSEENLWQMIREMGHVSTPTGARRFANRVFGITAGNPFYIIELLKTMFAQGLLAVDEETGAWGASVDALSGPGREFPVSRTVHDVIAERVDRLPEQLCEVLVSIAVAGAGCRAEVLSHVHGISRLHAAAVGDALVDRRLVFEEAGAYRCAHPVIAHVVRGGLTKSRRREIHRMLAQAIERATSPQELPNVAREIARHGDRGGESGLAYKYALTAADEALERYAFAEAMSWLDLAATNARTTAESDAINRRTANVLELAGWSEAPPLIELGGPVTRELVGEDFDLGR